MCFFFTQGNKKDILDFNFFFLANAPKFLLFFKESLKINEKKKNKKTTKPG